MKVAVIPALDEEASVGGVVEAFRSLRDEAGLPLLGDVIVADNGSRDGTVSRALAAGARVVHARRRGYGSACRAGVEEALRNEDVDCILFADADGSDDPIDSRLILREIDNGGDLVIGARIQDKRVPGALTLQQRFGNSLAVLLIRWIWDYRYHDLGPFRAIRREAYERLGMEDLDYGWTVEMQVKAIMNGLAIREVGVSYRKRIGKSKISGTFRGIVGAGTKIIWTILRLYFKK